MESILDIIINVFISMIAGVVAGIHSGIVVARMSKFEEIRVQIKRIIWGIDYGWTNNEPPYIKARRDIHEVDDLMGDLFYLGHKKAGEEAAKLGKSIADTFFKPPSTGEELNKLYINWQEDCRNLKPNYRVIFNLKPWV